MKIQLMINNIRAGVINAIKQPKVNDRITVKGEFKTEMTYHVKQVIPKPEEDIDFLVVLQ